LAPEIGKQINMGILAERVVAPADLDSQHPHPHTVQFYENDTFLLDDLSRFIGAALGVGDACIIIATQPHREELTRRLEARGLNTTLASAQGRYTSLDAAETLAKFMVDGRPDPTLFTEVVGATVARAAQTAGADSPRVAAFGEMVALLWVDGLPEAALELEYLWNDLARTEPLDLYCAYPMSLFGHAEDGDPIGKICAAHSHIVPTESYTSLVNDQDRLRAIALLQQKARALETEVEEHKKAVAARDEFLSVAAHELKTPLTSLRGFAQLLLRDARRNRAIPPERLKFALDAIEAQTGKLSHLVGRLLDSAQIEAGKLVLEPAKTDLVELVGYVLAQRQKSTGHTFIVDSPERVEAMVDPVRFEQVVTNLIDNAVKFSPEGGAVKVELHQDERGIRLSITDTGIGIPDDKREAVFDRFYQGHGERHLSGLGLGLYVAREIVQLHGGRIQIEEPEHSGSRVVVALPSPVFSA